MAYNLSYFAGSGAQFFDNNGSPLSGGLLYTYAAGTTTPATTYTTSTGAVANTNPIVLDSAGRPPQQIWISGGVLYKFILKTATGITLGTYDNIPGIDDPTVFNDLIDVTGTNTLLGTEVPPITGYVTGATYSFVVKNTNTGPVTISIDGLGAKDLTYAGAAPLVPGQLVANSIATIEYDGTRFQLMNSSAGIATVTALNGGQLAGLRNKIINGDCRVTQRGIVAAANNSRTYGGCDRIYIYPVSFTTYAGTISQWNAATGMVSGMAQSCSITSTGSGSFVFGQRIESANTRDLAGKTITVSCKVYHDTGSSLSVSMYLYKANVADNFTATTQVDTTKSVGNAASGAFTSVSSTFTVGSSDASNGLQIEVAFTSVGALTSKNFAIGDWQLEVGSVATPFEQRPYGLELALCQRYYYRITPGAINSLFNGVGGSTSSTASALMFQYPVQMRTTPAALEQSGTAADYAVFNLGSSSAINCSSVPTFAASTNTYGAQVSFSVASGLTAGQAIIGRTGSVSGANAYLGWSAEL